MLKLKVRKYKSAKLYYVSYFDIGVRGNLPLDNYVFPTKESAKKHMESIVAKLKIYEEIKTKLEMS
jgi:hypothetical protein